MNIIMILMLTGALVFFIKTVYIFYEVQDMDFDFNLPWPEEDPQPEPIKKQVESEPKSENARSQAEPAELKCIPLI